MATVTTVPTTLPTSVPTSLPTSVPTSVPTTVPTSIPTSVPTTVAPVSTTAANPVDVALAALSRHDNVEKLWKEKVTDVNLFLKLFGLIAYAFGKGAALEQDKVATEFSNKSAELVKAVANRRYTLEEAQQRNLAPVAFSNPDDQMLDDNWKAEADVKLDEFYNVFKTRITQLGINENSPEFGLYSAAAQKQIDSLSESKELLPNLKAPATLKTRINTTKQTFNERIFKDMINGYANQPIENLTIEGYKAKAALIKGYFANIETVDIEAQLRQAIKANHDATQFDAIRTVYANPAADNAKVAEIKAGMEAAINVEKTALETALAALRGPNGFDGEINTAVVAKQTAQTALNQAFTALQVALTQPGQAANGATVEQLLTLVTQFLGTGATTVNGATVNVSAIQVLAQTLATKQQEFAAADQALATKLARFNEIVQFAPNSANIVGGRLGVLNANLAGTAVAARAEANKIALFYNELNMVVGENNKVVRQRALRDIIN